MSTDTRPRGGVPLHQADPGAVMPIRDHLLELRRRVLLALAGIAVGACIGWFVVDPALAFLQRPLQEIAGSNPQLNFQTVGAAFDMRVTFALWIGLLLSSPWWVFQMARFVWPGLRGVERAYAATFGMVGLLLFGIGAYSGFLAAPRAIQILLSFVPQDAAVLLRVDAYVHFYLLIVIAFGLSLLLPLVLVGLNLSGVLSAKTMLRGWRWAVIGAFFFAAVVNPIPNPVPMIIQALSLVGLYLLAVGVAYIVERRRASRSA